jgi:hypothetical protein
VSPQQVEKFPARDAQQFRAFAGGNAAFGIPLHNRSFIHLTAKARLVAAELPHGIFGNFDCDGFRHNCNLSASEETVKSAFSKLNGQNRSPRPPAMMMTNRFLMSIVAFMVSAMN